VPAGPPGGPETGDARSATGRAGGGHPDPESVEAEPAPATEAAALESYGLSPELVDEIRARDRRQFELFVRIVLGGAGLLWVVLGVLVYSRSYGQAPLLGLIVAPLLAGLGAAIGALPIALLGGAAILVFYPRHPKAGALDRYEAAHARTRPCDVCILVRGDRRPRDDVAYCARCDAWLCPDCRGRYDLRAIAALRARGGRREPAGSSRGILPPAGRPAESSSKGGDRRGQT
jgi:hypothetical protein